MFPTRRIITSGGAVFRDEQSLAFNGLNDYVDFGKVLNLGVADFSICVWAKAPSDWHDTRILIKKADTNNRYWLRADTNNPPRLHFLALVGGAITISYVGGTAINLDTLRNEWVHFVISCDRDGDIVGYINGVLDDTDTPSDATPDIDNTGSLHIGKYDSTYYDQSISDIAYYDKALSANQVKTIYNGREPFDHKTLNFSGKGNLIAWWRMGDGILDHRQDDGLIADQTNATLGSELITGFTNGSSYPFDTFTTSGQNISAAIETTGNWGGCASNVLNLTAGQIYKCTLDLTYNSGDDTVRFLFASAATGGSTAVSNVKYTNNNGKHTMYLLVTTTDSTSYLQIGTWHSADEINFSATNISLKKVNGNAGVMVNMTAADFEGDTP